jgi:hypothetical protein
LTYNHTFTFYQVFFLCSVVVYQSDIIGDGYDMFAGDRVLITRSVIPTNHPESVAPMASKSASSSSEQYRWNHLSSWPRPTSLELKQSPFKQLNWSQLYRLVTINIIPLISIHPSPSDYYKILTGSRSVSPRPPVDAIHWWPLSPSLLSTLPNESSSSSSSSPSSLSSPSSTGGSSLESRERSYPATREWPMCHNESRQGWGTHVPSVMTTDGKSTLWSHPLEEVSTSSSSTTRTTTTVATPEPREMKATQQRAGARTVAATTAGAVAASPINSVYREHINIAQRIGYAIDRIARGSDVMIAKELMASSSLSISNLLNAHKINLLREPVTASYPLAGGMLLIRYGSIHDTNYYGLLLWSPRSIPNDSTTAMERTLKTTRTNVAPMSFQNDNLTNKMSKKSIQRAAQAAAVSASYQTTTRRADASYGTHQSDSGTIIWCTPPNIRIDTRGVHQVHGLIYHVWQAIDDLNTTNNRTYSLFSVADGQRRRMTINPSIELHEWTDYCLLWDGTRVALQRNGVMHIYDTEELSSSKSSVHALTSVSLDGSDHIPLHFTNQLRPMIPHQQQPSHQLEWLGNDHWLERWGSPIYEARLIEVTTGKTVRRFQNVLRSASLPGEDGRFILVIAIQHNAGAIANGEIDDAIAQSWTIARAISNNGASEPWFSWSILQSSTDISSSQTMTIPTIVHESPHTITAATPSLLTSPLERIAMMHIVPLTATMIAIASGDIRVPTLSDYGNGGSDVYIHDISRNGQAICRLHTSLPSISSIRLLTFPNDYIVTLSQWVGIPLSIASIPSHIIALTLSYFIS